MTQPPPINTIDAVVPPEEPPFALTLPQRQKVVLVMDLVESVRLMSANEVAVIDHWRGFVRYATSTVLPRHAGRLVKSLGDGIMAEFDSAREAAAAALELHRHFDKANAALPPEQKLYLRAGLNATHVYVDDIDIYGSGVNLAARVASLAGPGETMVTVEVRDGLVERLDAQIEDMGESYLKHIRSPVRTYRVGAPGMRPLLTSSDEQSISLHPAIAVIPFTALAMDRDDAMVLGDAIADDIIAALSQSTSLRVISRLSTAPFRGSSANVHDIQTLLGAAYVITGTYLLSGDRVKIRVQLCATKGGQVLWADGLEAGVSDIFHGQDTVVPAIAANAGRLILQKELERTRSLPLSTLESYTLYVGSISMLHRSSLQDFHRARDLLEHLSQRHPSRAAPHAMLAKWHLMRVLQGWSQSPIDDGKTALDMAQRALRCDPENAFSLATEGFVAAHLHSDLPMARRRCLEGLELNPQDAQIWRMMAGVHSYFGEGSEAQGCALRALALTPMDPTRFVFELVVGVSKLASGLPLEALEWAATSLRGNVMHVPTHRLRVIALEMAGRATEARDAAAELLKLSPGFRVDTFAQSYPGREQPHAQNYFQALRSAGLPG